MPLFESLPADAGLREVFALRPEIYRPWLAMGKAMAETSSFEPADRELLSAYVSALNACRFCVGIHDELARAHGVEAGVLDALVDDVETAPVDDRLKPVLQLVRTLTLTPSRVTPADVRAVRQAGWDERALHDAVLICCRMSFMNRLVEGFGLPPMSPEVARARAQEGLRASYHAAFASSLEPEADAAPDEATRDSSDDAS